MRRFCAYAMRTKFILIRLYLNKNDPAISLRRQPVNVNAVRMYFLCPNVKILPFKNDYNESMSAIFLKVQNV